MGWRRPAPWPDTATLSSSGSRAAPARAAHSQESTNRISRLTSRALKKTGTAPALLYQFEAPGIRLGCLPERIEGNTGGPREAVPPSRIGQGPLSPHFGRDKAVKDIVRPWQGAPSAGLATAPPHRFEGGPWFLDVDVLPPAEYGLQRPRAPVAARQRGILGCPVAARQTQATESNMWRIWVGQINM